MKRTAIFAVAGFVALAALAVAVNVGLQYLGQTRSPEVPIAPPPPPPPTSHITATLYYGSADGLSLAPARVEVPLADGAVAQGRQILGALLQPPPTPLLRLIPEGTTLKAFYLAANGDAFVDVSADVSTRHPGGSHNELLTVYSLVDTVVANLQGVQRVQILVDGKQADTIAGHIDVRRPLERDTSLVRSEPAPPATAQAPAVPVPGARAGAAPSAPEHRGARPSAVPPSAQRPSPRQPPAVQ